MAKLADSLTMGPVTLRVADLDLMSNYYMEAVGLKLIGESVNSKVFGGDHGTALILEHAPELRHAGPSEAGLFHTAFLFSTRAELASAVASVATKYPGSFTGSADHLVSEAFYFDDPEGNGVELYFDKERSLWSWQHGQVQMDTLRLDPNQYLADNLDPNANLSAPVIGHVHLSVGNIAQAKEFYVDQLGFDVTMDWAGTALFVSVGGYHHHMAMNIWRSRGAGRRQPTLGLRDVSLVLPNDQVFGAAIERLSSSNLKPLEENLVLVEDPWGNQVSLSY
jgi:catechol 2,3-dioxygenase